MDAREIRSLWEAAGGRSGPGPQGPGLLGLRVTRDAAALTGMGLAVLGVPLDGKAAWPAAVRRASRSYADWLPALGGGFRVADYGDAEAAGGDLASLFVKAHERLADIVAAGAAPLVLGGSALVSVPVLQVLSGKLRGRIGVIAFTPACEVAPDPPYAAESRWARALELGVLAPANLVVVGGRETPPDAPARGVLDGLGATAFTLDDVLRGGMTTVAQEALEIAAAGTEALYLSVDMGVIAGAGDPVGLDVRELVAGVAVVSRTLLAAADVCAGRGPAAATPAVHAAAGRVTAEIVAGVARGPS